MVLYMAFFTYKEIVLAAKDGGYMGKPISDIRDEFNKADFNRKKELCVLYADDERKGVKQLVAKYRREEESMAAELKRPTGCLWTVIKNIFRFTAVCGTA